MEIAKAASVASGANLRNGKLHSCPRNPHPAYKPPTLFDLASGASCGKFHKQNIHWKQLRQHNELSELLPRSQIAIDCSEVWVSTQPVFCSSWILCRADLHSFDQHTLGGKINLGQSEAIVGQ